MATLLGASVSGGGVNGGQYSFRISMASVVMGSVSTKHATSSKRDVEVKTSVERENTSGEEERIVRNLENINTSRTLNFSSSNEPRVHNYFTCGKQ